MKCGPHRKNGLAGKFRRDELVAGLYQIFDFDHFVEKETGWSEEIPDLFVEILFHVIANPETGYRYCPFDTGLYQPVHVFDPFAGLGSTDNKPAIRHLFDQFLQSNRIVTNVNLAYERYLGISS